MSQSDRIFADDWRDCLREQYRYVLQQQESRTEATLTQVLHEVGFSEDELAALKLDATLRAEDMPDDYVPEEVTQQYYAGVEVPDAAPVEAADEEALPDLTSPMDDIDSEPEIVTFDEQVLEAPVEALEAGGEPDDDEDAPQQLSLF
ncbi:MAG: hypothetical protein K8J31_26340 [Anaerolineae bacterium]|nr:hypothetical protein [Anaerolineae bacterium]